MLRLDERAGFDNLYCSGCEAKGTLIYLGKANYGRCRCGLCGRLFNNKTIAKQLTASGFVEENAYVYPDDTQKSLTDVFPNINIWPGR